MAPTNSIQTSAGELSARERFRKVHLSQSSGPLFLAKKLNALLISPTAVTSASPPTSTSSTAPELIAAGLKMKELKAHYGKSLKERYELANTKTQEARYRAELGSKSGRWARPMFKIDGMGAVREAGAGIVKRGGEKGKKEKEKEKERVRERGTKVQQQLRKMRKPPASVLGKRGRGELEGPDWEEEERVVQRVRRSGNFVSVGVAEEVVSDEATGVEEGGVQPEVEGSEEKEEEADDGMVVAEWSEMQLGVEEDTDEEPAVEEELASEAEAETEAEAESQELQAVSSQMAQLAVDDGLGDLERMMAAMSIGGGEGELSAVLPLLSMAEKESYRGCGRWCTFRWVYGEGAVAE